MKELEGGPHVAARDTRDGKTWSWETYSKNHA